MPLTLREACVDLGIPARFTTLVVWPAQSVRDLAEARAAHTAALADARAACLLAPATAEAAGTLTAALQCILDFRSALRAQRCPALLIVLLRREM